MNYLGNVVSLILALVGFTIAFLTAMGSDSGAFTIQHILFNLTVAAVLISPLGIKIWRYGV